MLASDIIRFNKLIIRLYKLKRAVIQNQILRSKHAYCTTVSTVAYPSSIRHVTGNLKELE